MRAVTFEFGSLVSSMVLECITASSLCGTVLLGLANVFIVGFCINELLIILVTGIAIWFCINECTFYFGYWYALSI